MRVATLFLLLFMAIDLTSLCRCEDDVIDVGAPGAQSINALASSTQTGGTELCHECFCCCRHIQAQRVVRVARELPLVEVVQNRQPHAVNVAPAPVYHPPRLISL